MTRKRKSSNESILSEAFPKLKYLFRHFSKETSFHGFKRLWVGSWVRWPFWTFIIFGGVIMSIYQIKNKLDILIANPMSINMNIVYHNGLDFPSVTICNKIKVRVSFVVNNSILLNLLHEIDPNAQANVNEQVLIDLQNAGNMLELNEVVSQATSNVSLELTKNDWEKVDKLWNTKQFFAQSGIPEEEFILWCELPNGEHCVPDDFKSTITDEGYCFTLNKELFIREAGRGSLKILINLADYERIPIFESETVGGAWIVIHEPDEKPMPSKGYDLMPGYQVKITLRKTKDKHLGNCEAGNPLTYYGKYTYPACRMEQKLTYAAEQCQCKPFMLPNIANYKGKCIKTTICSQYMGTYCLDFLVGNRTSDVFCTGECIREAYDQHIYQSYLKDSLFFFFKTKISQDRLQLLQESYQTGKDSAAFLRFYKRMDQTYQSIVDASRGFENVIVKNKLVPPYGTVANVLLERLNCLDDLLHVYGKNITLTTPTGKSSKKKDARKSLYGALVKQIKNFDAKMETLDVEELFTFSYSLTKIHLNKCTGESKEICSLAALYDLLKIRTQLTSQKQHVHLLNESFKNFSRVVNQFLSRTQFRFPSDNDTELDDDKRLNHMLQYYLRQVSVCLKETNRIYDKILNAGQPNMKTSNLYYGFLNDLHMINLTITGTCRKGGAHIQSLFNVSSRRELALKTLSLMATTEVEPSKSALFGNVMAELVEKIQKKLLALDYDKHLLNESLQNIQTIDSVLEKYLSQTTKDVFKKSQFYSNLYKMKGPFQKGLNHYKTIVTKHIIEMDGLFQTYIEKLMQLYPGPESDMIHLMDLNLENVNESSVGDSSTLEHIICLKKAKEVLSTIATADDQTLYLDNYKQTVDTLYFSLKQYDDEIRSIQKIFRDNLAFVKVSFQDMGVKESVQERVYDILSFLCDIGGIVGLWLGGSIVSLIEIFDLVFFEHVETCSNKEENRYEDDYDKNADRRKSPIFDASATGKQKPPESCLESLL